MKILFVFAHDAAFLCFVIICRNCQWWHVWCSRDARYLWRVALFGWYSTVCVKHVFNSLPPERCGCNLKIVIFKLYMDDSLVQDCSNSSALTMELLQSCTKPSIWYCISCEIALRWMPQDLIEYYSTLVQVMAWGHQATSHCLSQCWSRSISSYGITRSQGVKFSPCRWKKLIFKCKFLQAFLINDLWLFFLKSMWERRPWTSSQNGLVPSGNKPLSRPVIRCIFFYEIKLPMCILISLQDSES